MPFLMIINESYNICKVNLRRDSSATDQMYMNLRFYLISRLKA